MQYKYVTKAPDYSDLSSGRVFYSLPGHPAFPVRLASEIFQRCAASRQALDPGSGPCTLYDPCCGAAYHLSVLAYLHREHIREVIASDVDKEAVALAERNLGLLTIAGLDGRISEISRMLQQYGKDSHQDALESAYHLKSKFSTSIEKHPLQTKSFQASATEAGAMLHQIKPGSVDIVLTDIPYGINSRWHDSDFNELPNPVWSMLEALRGVLSRSSVVAIVSDKLQKVSHESYQRLEQFQIGKRRVVILKPG